MKKDIYVQLLNEGTKVYRPVPSTKIENNIYRIEGSEIHDPKDEIWKFIPGDVVIVEEQNLEGKNVLVAIKKKD